MLTSLSNTTFLTSCFENSCKPHTYSSHVCYCGGPIWILMTPLVCREDMRMYSNHRQIRMKPLTYLATTGPPSSASYSRRRATSRLIATKAAEVKRTTLKPSDPAGTSKGFPCNQGMRRWVEFPVAHVTQHTLSSRYNQP